MTGGEINKELINEKFKNIDSLVGAQAEDIKSMSIKMDTLLWTTARIESIFGTFSQAHIEQWKEIKALQSDMIETKTRLSIQTSSLSRTYLWLSGLATIVITQIIYFIFWLKH